MCLDGSREVVSTTDMGRLIDFCNRLWITISTCCGGNGQAVPVKLHYTLILIPILAIISIIFTTFSIGSLFLVLIGSGPLLFFAVLIHEVGHLYACAQCGGQPEYILLWPMGGLAVSSKTGSTYSQRFYIAAMGPAMHIPMFFFWFLLLVLINQGFTLDYSAFDVSAFGDWFIILTIQQCWLNILMFVFNALVPCFPLDCSQMVMCTMAMRGYEPTSIAKCMCYTSAPIILILVAFGIWELIETGGGAMSLFVALWLAYQTWGLWSSSTSNETLLTHPTFTNPPSGSTETPPVATSASSVGGPAGLAPATPSGGAAKDDGSDFGQFVAQPADVQLEAKADSGAEFGAPSGGASASRDTGADFGGGGNPFEAGFPGEKKSDDEVPSLTNLNPTLLLCLGFILQMASQMH